MSDIVTYKTSDGTTKVKIDSSGDMTVSGAATLSGGAAISGLKPALVSKTAAYTATATDCVILCDATTAAFTVTLPAAASSTDLLYVIKKIDSSTNAVTVDGNASETIDGAATVSLASQYDSVMIVCDGTGWYKV